MTNFDEIKSKIQRRETMVEKKVTYTLEYGEWNGVRALDKQISLPSQHRGKRFEADRRMGIGVILTINIWRMMRG